MTQNDDETPEALAEVRIKDSHGQVWSVQRRPYQFPGKLYPPWEVKEDGDNWPDQPDDWFDIKE